MDYATKLQLVAKQRNHSQRDIARITGVTNSTVNRWITGQIIPRLDEAVSIAKHFDVPLQWFVDEGSSLPSSEPAPEGNQPLHTRIVVIESRDAVAADTVALLLTALTQSGEVAPPSSPQPE